MANRRARTRAADIVVDKAVAEVDNVSELDVPEMVGANTAQNSPPPNESANTNINDIVQALVNALAQHTKELIMEIRCVNETYSQQTNNTPEFPNFPNAPSHETVAKIKRLTDTEHRNEIVAIPTSTLDELCTAAPQTHEITKNYISYTLTPISGSSEPVWEPTLSIVSHANLATAITTEGNNSQNLHSEAVEPFAYFHFNTKKAKFSSDAYPIASPRPILASFSSSRENSPVKDCSRCNSPNHCKRDCPLQRSKLEISVFVDTGQLQDDLQFTNNGPDYP